MGNQLDRLEADLEELKGLVAGLTSRLDTLETGTPQRLTCIDTLENTEDQPQRCKTEDSPERITPAVMISLVGRSCLVFCGAFLLRAMTEAGTIPQGAGIILGLAYAVFWLIAAERAGRKSSRLSAEFHGMAFAVIAFPLLVEATSSFNALSPGTAAAVLTLFGTLGLIAAWIRRLPVLAWGTSLATLLTALILIRLTYRHEPFAVVLLLLGLVTVWLAYGRGWHGIRWFTAFGANLVILHMSILAASKIGPHPPFDQLSVAAAGTMALVLFVFYLASFSIRTLVRHRNVTAFEVVQTVAVLLIGFGGAARISRTSGSGLVVLGMAALLLAIAGYAVAFVSVDRRLGRGTNFYFFTSLAIILMLYGSSVAFPASVFVPLWCLLGLATAALGGRFDRVTLRAHAAVFLGAAALATGFPGAVRDAFIESPDSGNALSLLGILVLGFSLICHLVLSTTGAGIDSTWAARLPRFFVAMITAAGLGALIINIFEYSTVVDASNPGRLAAVRSLVLAGAALGLAAVGRREVFRELRWLVYPVLVIGGLKLVFVDLPNGNPATLFLAFAAFGTALIVAPKLLKHPDPQGASNGPSPEDSNPRARIEG